MAGPRYSDQNLLMGLRLVLAAFFSADSKVLLRLTLIARFAYSFRGGSYETISAPRAAWLHPAWTTFILLDRIEDPK
jgi:hypothetical protein